VSSGVGGVDIFKNGNRTCSGRLKAAGLLVRQRVLQRAAHIRRNILQRANEQFAGRVFQWRL